jgi:hypothetical protein
MLGIVLVALGSASLGFAFANRDYAEPEATAGWTNYVPLDDPSSVPGLGLSFDARQDLPCFDCVDPVPWLAAGSVLILVASVPFFVAVRRR